MKNIQAFKGVHCETTATGTLLLNAGIKLSEPMLFGIGEGLGFIFWNMKNMALPFLGGRTKPDLLTANIARNLGVELAVSETTSLKKAWHEVRSVLDSGEPVGLKLDCYHLEYFTRPVHFAGHYVAIYDYDDEYAYVVDTIQQGGLCRTKLENLAKARAEKGPMSSRNLHYTIRKSWSNFNLKDIIPAAIRRNAAEFITPPISNVGYKGIEKTGRELEKWFKSSRNVESDFTVMGMMMEKAGSGGSLFRNLYRDFLHESLEICPSLALEKAYLAYAEAAILWRQVSELFEKTGKEKERAYLREAAFVLKQISEIERKAMSGLAEIV